MTSSHQTVDPMDAAMQATDEPRERTYFGEVVTADAWFVVLERGVGKRLFDAAYDDPAQRRTAIKIEIDPLKGEFLVTQECLHFERAWLGHTLPSLQKLGVNLNALKGRYCQVKRVPTGEVYQNKQGETKEKSALVFVAVYDDGAACVQAADAFFGSRGSGGAGAAAMPSMPPEQEFALRSLPALWKASNHDQAAFRLLVESNPLISTYYPFDGPYIQALIRGDVGELFPDVASAQPARSTTQPTARIPHVGASVPKTPINDDDLPF